MTKPQKGAAPAAAGAAATTSKPMAKRMNVDLPEMEPKPKKKRGEPVLHLCVATTNKK